MLNQTDMLHQMESTSAFFIRLAGICGCSKCFFLLSSDRQGGAVRADASGWGSGLFVYWRRELLKSSLSLSGCLGITGWSFQHHDHSPLNAEETTPHCPVCTLGCTDIFKCNNWYQPIMDIYPGWYHCIHLVNLVPSLPTTIFEGPLTFTVVCDLLYNNL